MTNRGERRGERGESARSRALLTLAFCTTVAAAPLQAQIGEVHLGAVASYGTSQAYGQGAGLLAGVAAGRLTYLGLRWTSYHGTMSAETTPGGTADVRNRTSAYVADLGLMIPAGPVDIIAGSGLGLLHFTQIAHSAGGESTRHADEFIATPGVAVELHLLHIAIIPEIQYSLSGNPDLPYHVATGGFLATLRLVYKLEAGRVRY